MASLPVTSEVMAPRMIRRVLGTDDEVASAGGQSWIKPPHELQLSQLAGIALCVGILFGVGVYLLRQSAPGPSLHPPVGITQVRLIAPPDSGAAAKEAARREEAQKAEVPPAPMMPKATVSMVSPPKPASKTTPRAESSDNHRSASVATLELPPSAEQLRDLTDSTILDVRKMLFDHIKRFSHYPDAARPAHLHGVVQLLIDMDRTGRVLSVRVKTSSGYAVLDREAVDTIRRAQPLPPLPASFPDRLPLLFPIEFDPPS
jgi:periplasmic protein TonB